MGFRQDLITFLTASASLTALVGTRISPTILEGSQIPFIRYEIDADDEKLYSGGKGDYQFIDVTFTIHGSTYANADAIAQVINGTGDGTAGSSGLLNPYTGAFGNGFCRLAKKTSDTDLTTSITGGESSDLIRRMLTYSFIYSE